MTHQIVENAPDWANWMAQDFTGHWWFHECKPYQISQHESGIGIWMNKGRLKRSYKDKPNPNWRDELYELYWVEM